MKVADLYAPPRAPLAGSAPGDEPELPPWRLMDRTLYVRNHAKLPDVCLFSGEPTTPQERVQLPLSWTPSWFRGAAVVFPFLAVLFYDFVRKTATVEIGLARAGRQRRARFKLLILGAVGDVLGLLYLGTETSGSRPIAAALVLALGGLVGAAAASRIVRVVKIDRRSAHLRLRPEAAAAFARLPQPTFAASSESM